MPAENLEHEGLAKNPNLELAQYKFYLTLDQHKNDASVKQKLMEAICSDGKLVAPSYYLLSKGLLKGHNFLILFLQIWHHFTKKSAKI